MKSAKTFIAAILMALCLPAAAQQKLETNLWPQGAPNSNGDQADTAKVWVYLPNKKEATGRAVVICPGGGYQHLAMNHEGHDWASFFNNMGIAAIVLKYRMPHGNHEVPVSLASTIATHSTGDAAPDFQILFYPVITMMSDITHKGSHDNFLGEKPKKKQETEYSNDLQVTRVTPRAFIALSDDDATVLPANGVNYYIELYRHDVPATLHVYPSGGHGWGNRDSFKYHNEMQLELKAWLRSF